MSAAEILNGETLKAERERLDLSVRALARLANVGRGIITRFEKGDPVTQEILDKLTFALRGDSYAIRCAQLDIEPGSREELYQVVPYELDPVAQYLVRCHPDGMSRKLIGAYLDMDPRTVKEIEESALKKLKRCKDGSALKPFLQEEPIDHDVIGIGRPDDDESHDDELPQDFHRPYSIGPMTENDE